jgi:tetratricopeptide (TPR) repeat protein
MKTTSMRNIAIMLVLAVSGHILNGQDRNEVVAAYNEGAKVMQTDVKAAIKAFENVVSLSDKVGESANDLKQKAVQVLPGLYLKATANAINEKKPADEIVKAARAAVAASEKYKNQSSADNAKKLLAQAYSIKGSQLFAKKDYDNALQAFDSALIINPEYSAAYFNKALIYRVQNNADAFEQSIDTYIEKLKASNDEARIKQASNTALEYFRAAGSQANQANKLDDALALLNKAAKYGEDKDLNYFFADVYNKQKNFDKAAEYAQKGLDMETGTAEAKAKFYFQLGLAQAGKGDKEKACASFKNAMFGPFAAPSKAERTNLKCE